MKIILPLAGPSAFFNSQDYPYPKPIIEIQGRPMIELAVENLRGLSPEAEFVFVALKSDVIKYSYEGLFRLATGGRSKIVSLAEKTSGMLCSCLLAIDHIDPDEPLVIANFDQMFSCDLAAILRRFETARADAGVITFDSIHPRWSYVQVDEAGACLQFCEKTVISRDAIAGFYYFRRGRDFIEAAKWSIRRGDAVGQDFYVAPILNYFVLNEAKVAAVAVPNEAYHSFYTPQKIEAFEREQLAKAAAAPRALPPVNLVVPAAGQGSRFAKQGYAKPKPFIDVKDRPMIELVLDNLGLPGAREILLLRREHIEAEAEVVSRLDERGCSIVPVEGLTEGTLCTVLLSRQLIDEDRPLLIANSDQLADFSCEAFVRDCFDRGLDGSILVFRDPEMNPKWSFARLNDDGTVAEVAEKQPISDLATVGVYLFRRGHDFVRAAIDMIAHGDRVNNEFYTCPVYNYAIKNGLKIGVYEIPMAAMHGLGTPEDLNAYLAADAAAQASGRSAA
jgi:dTDP-glucose pyrophosphorylase